MVRALRPGHDGTAQRIGRSRSASNSTSIRLGIAQIENLTAEQSAIRNLSGLPNFTSSLGTARVNVRDNILATPLAMELGLTKRISVSVMVRL